MIRVYWWCIGVPETRIGGPWWCRDFLTIEEAKIFILDMSSLCEEMRMCEVEPGTATGEPWDIKPPPEAQKVWYRRKPDESAHDSGAPHNVQVRGRFG